VKTEEGPTLGPSDRFPDLHLPCVACGVRWFHGHRADCSKRLELPPLPEWYIESKSRAPDRTEPRLYAHVVEQEESDSTNRFLLAAQRLVACGLNVIPVRRQDKRPAVRWERFQRQRLLEWDVDKIDDYLCSWWGRPDPFNLGLVTGEVSGIVVVDVDSLSARQLVIDTIGCWPRTVDTEHANHPAVTPTATTPGDGWHLWYRYRAGVHNVVRRGGEKLDARGDGGYVVVPPSSIGRRDYRWGVSPFVSEGGVWPPAPMPDELHALLWPARKVTMTTVPVRVLMTKYIDVALEREVADVASATEGTRNDQLNPSAYALARFVREGQLSASVFVEQLTAAASLTGLPETEIRRTIASALQGRS
jgi:Bifunctional DNA primase/polymerase, N-terminal